MELNLLLGKPQHTLLNGLKKQLLAGATVLASIPAAILTTIAREWRITAE